MGQLLISLFTTGGRINPIALVIFAATVLLGYQYFNLRSEHYELVRQYEVLKDASKEKLNTLNGARNDQAQAADAINNGTFDNEFLKRLQFDD